MRFKEFLSGIFFHYIYKTAAIKDMFLVEYFPFLCFYKYLDRELAVAKRQKVMESASWSTTKLRSVVELLLSWCSHPEEGQEHTWGSEFGSHSGWTGVNTHTQNKSLPDQFFNIPHQYKIRLNSHYCKGKPLPVTSLAYQNYKDQTILTMKCIPIFLRIWLYNTVNNVLSK